MRIDYNRITHEDILYFVGEKSFAKIDMKTCKITQRKIIE